MAENTKLILDEQQEELGDSLTPIEQLTRGEYDIQIATAKRYPRDMTKFINAAIQLCTYSESVAEECLYALERTDRTGTKTIEGPSARFAEIVLSAWGNCRSAARVVGDDSRFVTAQGVFYDLERNVAVTTEVKRRITTKEGKRYGDDMVGVTSNAACSIAARNAVLKGIPKAIWWPIYEQAKQCAVGTVQTLSDKRQKAIEYLGKMGATQERIFAALGVGGIEDVTLDHLATLKGFVSRLKDGETVAAVFVDDKAAGTSGRRVRESAVRAEGGA